jgi:hypothetical protein
VTGTCAPAARVEGDPELAARIDELLVASGVSTAGQTSCPMTVAKVSRSGSGIALDIRDGAGRTSERSIDKPSTAAVLIESWARTDTESGLLDPIHVAASAEPAAELAKEAQQPEQPISAGAAVSAEGSLATGGAFWYGARVAGCAVVGDFCLGAIGRFGSALSAKVGPDLEAAVLASIEVPWRLGRLILAPGLAFGARWQRGVAPTVVDNDAGGYGSDASTGRDDVTVYQHATAVQTVADVHLRALFPVAGSFAVELIGTAEVHPNAWALSGPASLTDGRWGAVRVGLGLRWGGS